jgi:hypothetical protein
MASTTSVTSALALPSEDELSALVTAVMDLGEQVEPIRQRVIEVIALGCDGAEHLDRVEVSDYALVNLAADIATAADFLGDVLKDLEEIRSATWFDELRGIGRGSAVHAIPAVVDRYRASEAFDELMERFDA